MTVGVEPGEEVGRLLGVLEEVHGLREPSARQQKLEEARRILARGPVASGRSSIGLALGYVQSGKTMSFTTLAALAADTGYRIVILILGNTHLLVDQNTHRLLGDLGIDERADRRWVPLHLPHQQDLDFLLAQDDRVLLITVLKNRNRLEKVAELLRSSQLARSVPALIIDDEADQASLNAGVRKGRRTPVYSAIQGMRSALPRHLYMQYTATPFAPLLLEPTDELAPEFLELLVPGAGYTGGTAFFVEHRARIARPIDESEGDDKSPSRLPKGLNAALLAFFASAALLRADGRLPHTTSMLVHTSGMKIDHRAIRVLLEANLGPLRDRASLPEDDPARRGFVRRFDDARRDLTDHGMPDVDDATFGEHISWCVRRAKVWEVNSSKDAESLDWRISPLNLLIGGNKLDRGFTVKGLTTTYMTRGTAGGQADTIEQRARCYGYKAGYLDACRFYAPQSVIDSFTSLVHTEADMRESLLAWTAASRPLQDWSAKEGLMLPDDMRPTRPTVLTETYSRSMSGWTFLRRPSLDGLAAETNRRLLEDIGLMEASLERIGGVAFRVLTGLPTTAVVDEVLSRWQIDGSPGWDHPQVLRSLRLFADAGLLPRLALLHLEATEGGKERPRHRQWVDPGGFVQLHQGRDQGTGYPGDRNLLPGVTQLQFHRLASPSGVEVFGLALYVSETVEGPTKNLRRL